MSRRRMHAQEQAQSIIESGVVDVDEVETWSDEDLYDWLEAWGYEWDDSFHCWSLENRYALGAQYEGEGDVNQNTMD